MSQLKKNVSTILQLQKFFSLFKSITYLHNNNNKNITTDAAASSSSATPCCSCWVCARLGQNYYEDMSFCSCCCCSCLISKSKRSKEERKEGRE
jgi:hypothetical protein